MLPLIKKKEGVFFNETGKNESADTRISFYMCLS